MKIAGIFNPLGFNPLKSQNFKCPINLNVVYIDNQGKYYIQYLNTGSFPLLMSRLESLKTKEEKEREIIKFLKCRFDLSTYILEYYPIKNEYFYKKVCFDEIFQKSYCNIEKYPSSKLIIEPTIQIQENNFNQAVQMPNNDLYIGNLNFITNSILPQLTIEGKTAQEIKATIYWLIQNMYLEEASNMLDELRSTLTNLDEYKHPKNLFILDSSTNFLEHAQYKIEDLNLVKEKTKSLNLKIFNRK